MTLNDLLERMRPPAEDSLLSGDAHTDQIQIDPINKTTTSPAKELAKRLKRKSVANNPIAPEPDASDGMSAKGDRFIVDPAVGIGGHGGNTGLYS